MLTNLNLDDIVKAFAKAVAEELVANPPFQAPLKAEPDEWLSVKEAARRLGVSPVTIYRNWRDYPFTRRQGMNGHTLRISSQGLETYLREKEKGR